jgi:signal transduction histidine kinase
MENSRRQQLDLDPVPVPKPGSDIQLPLAAAVRRLPDPLQSAALFVAYVGFEWVSFLHEHNGLPVTPWNPGLGVAFAVLVRNGPAYGLVLFAAVVFTETVVLRTELAWIVIVAMACVIAGTFTASAVLARRRWRLHADLEHLRDVVVLLAVGAAAAALSAALLSLLLIATNELGTGDLTQASVPLLVGDMIGIAVMTPLTLRLWARWPHVAAKPTAGLALELVLHLLAIGAALWVIVGAGSLGGYKFFSLLFLPVVAAAVRHGIDGSCLSLAATQMGLVGLLGLLGHDAAAFTEFQVVMLALTTAGLIVGVVVSERRHADLVARGAEERLKDLQAQAARAARINMVSSMASALAHEINQPMTAARALARSVQHILGGPEPDMGRARNNLAGLIAQVDHAGGVVRRMREFLRRGQPHFSTLDMQEVLEDALVLARPEAASKRTSIALTVRGPLPPIFGDRIQLQQVVLNLVHNSAEAIVESRRADGHIRIEAVVSPQEPAIVVAVADNGIGVSGELRLFEPLTSSKKDGLGLGLSVCASIVQAHGGRIWLQSGEAGGTEFRFTLPLQRGQAAPA